jgi:signal transduction histidine kinase
LGRRGGDILLQVHNGPPGLTLALLWQAGVNARYPRGEVFLRRHRAPVAFRQLSGGIAWRMSHIETAGAVRSYRLLVVDDDAVDRRLYSRLLTQQGPGCCDVQQAADGAAGLALLRAEPFDCVLLDFGLPDMTGLEFLRDATAGGELPCAVVVVTGQGNEAIAVAAMKCGAQDYLIKDRVNASSLWRAMTTAVTQTGLRQQLACSLRDLKAANAALEHEAAVRRATEIELRAAKEAAEQANQAKTRFVATVTHELRTPLNGILGYAELLRIEGGLSVRQDARVGAMMHAGQHLLEMIERVLDLASIETGRMELHPDVVPVRDLCDRCIAFVAPLAAEHALSLRVVSAPDTPRQIVADPARLRQLILNLLGNAVKYTCTGGIELHVLAGAAPGGLRIEVADTGPGISEAHRDRLFHDFERLGATTSVEGAGLGLAIAVRIVGLMGGTIGYTPNPGGGSVFWLELPTAEAVAPPGPGPVPDVPPAAPTGRRVLIVDDIAMNRDVIGSFLCAAGYVVVLAEGGQEAVRLAFEQPFDLILMDVRMPGMDGLEATRRIRALPAPRGQVPILALTAFSFLDQVDQCRDAGMDGHIAKPVQYATLVSAIAGAIAHAPLGWTEDQSPPPPDCAEDQAPMPLDRAIFDQTLGFLPAGEVATNLQSLHTRMDRMLALLEQPATAAQQTETAHALASAAGIFGFLALSATLRSFERALAHDAPEAAALARQACEETRAAMAALGELMGERQI